MYKLLSLLEWFKTILAPSYILKLHKLFKGSAAVFAGRPGRFNRQDLLPDSDNIEDWSQCIKSFSVSSRESTAHHLIDPFSDMYWQSAGSQGKVSGCNFSICDFFF